MLFSATLDRDVNVLVRRFLTRPGTACRKAVAAAPDEMVHHLLTVMPADRVSVVAVLAGGRNRSLIFTRTKHAAHKLARQLTAARIPAAELHGDLAQNARERNLATFASGAARVMVATDVATTASAWTALTWSSTPIRRPARGLSAPVGASRARGRLRRGDDPADARASG